MAGRSQKIPVFQAVNGVPDPLRRTADFGCSRLPDKSTPKSQKMWPENHADFAPGIRSSRSARSDRSLATTCGSSRTRGPPARCGATCRTLTINRAALRSGLGSLGRRGRLRTLGVFCRPSRRPRSLKPAFDLGAGAGAAHAGDRGSSLRHRPGVRESIESRY